MVFVGRSMEGNYQPQLVLALLDVFWIPWVSMILRKLKQFVSLKNGSALGKVGAVWWHSNAKPGVVPRLWTRWAMWSVVASLPQVPISRLTTATLGIEVCLDPMEQKDTKRGGHFLYKPTEQVYAKSNRDTFCYGPEALCLRASPRSSSEPRVVQKLVQQDAVWTRDMTSTMEAVSKSDTCRHICHEQICTVSIVAPDVRGSRDLLEPEIQVRGFFKTNMYTYRDMCRLRNASSVKCTAYINIYINISVFMWRCMSLLPVSACIYHESSRFLV